MKTKIYLRKFLAHSLLLRIKNVSPKFVEKIKTHILCSILSSRKSCRLCVNVGKYGTAGQATDDNVAHAHCMLYTRRPEKYTQNM